MSSTTEMLSADDPGEHRSILVRGLPVWYRTRGSGSPWLLLPGWGGPTDKYDALLNGVAGEGAAGFHGPRSVGELGRGTGGESLWASVNLGCPFLERPD